MVRLITTVLPCVTVAISPPQINYPILKIDFMETSIFKAERLDLKKINNPFNIRPSSSKWKGEIGAQNGFVVFDSMEHGARAGVINLANGYFNKGINTIAKIVAKYAPASENDDTKYIAFLTKNLGIAQNTKIDPVHDTFRDVAFYIVWYENGEDDVCTKKQLDDVLEKYGFEYISGKINFKFQ